MIKLKSIVKEIFDANLLENNVEITIYCDMDGVLCDFEKQFEKLTSTPPKEFEASNGTKEFWNVILQEGEKFWSTMDTMPEFDYFKTELTTIATDGRFKLKFLTSTSAGQILRNYPRQEAVDYIKNIESGKRTWLRTHWSGPISIIFSDSGKSKAKYATPNSILIDDLSSNIEAFIASGGNGIIFTDAHQAIDELKAKIKI
jgi:PAS domain-containing protein